MKSEQNPNFAKAGFSSLVSVMSLYLKCSLLPKLQRYNGFATDDTFFVVAFKRLPVAERTLHIIRCPGGLWEELLQIMSKCPLIAREGQREKMEEKKKLR